jgi:hypothetical protein
MATDKAPNRHSPRVITEDFAARGIELFFSNGHIGVRPASAPVLPGDLIRIQEHREALLSFLRSYRRAAAQFVSPENDK